MTAQQIADAALALDRERREAERRGDTATAEARTRERDATLDRLA